MYNEYIDCFKYTFQLIQDPNGIDDKKDSEILDMTFHIVPGFDVDKPESKFLVLKTDQWSLDYNDIDKFAEYLKSLFNINL